LRQTDPSITQCWPQEFNLRAHEQDGQNAFKTVAVSVDTKPNVAAPALEAARGRIQYLFNRSSKQREILTATRLLRNLEQILGMPKSEWNAALSAPSGQLWKAVWLGARSRRTTRRPGSFSLVSCCARGSGLLPTTFASTVSGAFTSMDSILRANEPIFRNISSGAGSRAASSGNVRSRSSHPSSTKSAPEEGCPRTYSARGIIGTPSHANEDGIG
jgi:hypothetical protein